MRLKPGDTVVSYNPGSYREHESWTRGVITETLRTEIDGAIHLVMINGFKWDSGVAFGEHGGNPEMIVREHPFGCAEVEFLESIYQFPPPLTDPIF